MNTICFCLLTVGAGEDHTAQEISKASALEFCVVFNKV